VLPTEILITHLSQQSHAAASFCTSVTRRSFAFDACFVACLSCLFPIPRLQLIARVHSNAPFVIDAISSSQTSPTIILLLLLLLLRVLITSQGLRHSCTPRVIFPGLALPLLRCCEPHSDNNSLQPILPLHLSLLDLPTS